MPYEFLSASALRTSRPWWLVELYFGGSPLRLAGADLEVTDSASGTSLHFIAAFDDLDVNEQMEILNDSAGQNTVNLDAVLPVDVAALIAQGQILDGARVTLSQWVEGTDWSLRRVVFDGIVQGPQYGMAGEPVSLTMAQTLYSQPAVMPRPSEIVTGTTWSTITTLSEEWLGLPYPIVIGKPGVVATDLQSDGRISASKAVWVDFGDVSRVSGWSGLTAVIADHHVQTERVLVSSDDFLDGFRAKVTNGFDALGQPLAVLLWYYSYSGTGNVYTYDGTIGHYTFSTTESDGTVIYGLGHNSVHNTVVTDVQPQLYVSWYDPIGGKGSQVYRGRLLRDAGDVLRWALEKTGQPVDHGRCAAQAPLLARFKIDAVIDKPVDPWTWIRDALLPVLPVSIEAGGEGYYFRVWRWDATAADAIDHLDGDADPDVEFLAPIKSDSQRLATEFTLKYAYCARTAECIATATVGAVDFDATKKRTLPNALCLGSATRRRAQGLEPLVADTLETDVVYDDATAMAVLGWRAASRTYPQERATLRLTPDRAAGKEQGSVVTLTRSGLGLHRCVALIERMTPGAADVVELQCILRRWPGIDLGSAA